MNQRCDIKWLYLIVLVCLVCLSAKAHAEKIPVVDDKGRVFEFNDPPSRVVCLVPSVAEILFALGVDRHVAGLTWHSGGLPGAVGKAVVGGFGSPSFDRIMALNPDLIIASSYQTSLIEQIGKTVPVCVLDTRIMNDAFRHIEMMGALFDHDEAAAALIEKNRNQLDIIARKVATIPMAQRKRVMRLMGRDHVMTPGNDSFQNEMIRAAGGLAPDFGKAGKVVPVTQTEFLAFNPQVIYGCGDDLNTAGALLKNEGWQTVEAVRGGRLFTFPCDMTCRAGVHLGDFVSWLASMVYAESFSDPANHVLPRSVIATRSLSVDLAHVKQARVETSVMDDFENKTLIVDFKTPRTVMSTLDGQRSGILTVGNHYSPPPSWSLNHGIGLADLRVSLGQVIGKDPAHSVLLFTGADMDHLAVKKESFKDMTVTALVTAGIRGNAMRMGIDSGNYYEPGTINMVILSNMALSPRAMTRAIIAATEAKTAALEDLDIRSSYTPVTAGATGTGTDNIIVVPGDGAVIDNAGGHSKMGELIARAAYAGVREAVARQNGIEGGRNVFQRLKERRLTVSHMLGGARCLLPEEPPHLLPRVEALLVDPVYAGFVEGALALSDGLIRGTVQDLTVYETTCLDLAARIADKPVKQLAFDLTALNLPQPLALALNALMTGAVYQDPVGKARNIPPADCGCE